RTCITPAEATARMTTIARTTPGSSTASSAVTEPRSLPTLVGCRRWDGCGARTGFISAADRQRLADEAQQQPADLVATQDRQQQGGERHRGQRRDRILGGGHPGLGGAAYGRPPVLGGRPDPATPRGTSAIGSHRLSSPRRGPERPQSFEPACTGWAAAGPPPPGCGPPGASPTTPESWARCCSATDQLDTGGQQHRHQPEQHERGQQEQPERQHQADPQPGRRLPSPGGAAG